jgi:acyl-homoserine lactone acylase PvdQ
MESKASARILLRRWREPAVRSRGTLPVEGLESDVLVHRGRYGIVHVEALDEAGARFGCGFCQGQDRPRRAPLVVAQNDDPFARGVRAGAMIGRRRPPRARSLLTGDLPAEELDPQWYLVHIRTPHAHLAGAQRVGDATVVAGHDEETSWPDDPRSLPGLRVHVPDGSRDREWRDVRVAYAGGQCDDPDSPHFEDLTPFWRSGHGVPIAWTRDEVAVATTATLRLTPPR